MKQLLLSTLLLVGLAAHGQAQQLDSLSGQVKTYFPLGAIGSARATQQLVQEAEQFYQTTFPGRPFTVRLSLKPAVPVPMYVAEQNTILVGVKGRAVPHLFRPADHSPADTVDLVVIHELGHYFFYTRHPTPIPAKWADEFFATYFAVCFLETRKELLLLSSAGDTYAPHYHTLADFERLYYGVGGQNYGWYQGQFAALAYTLYPKFKTKLLAIALEEYGPTGKHTPPLELLQTLAPKEVAAWRKNVE